MNGHVMARDFLDHFHNFQLKNGGVHSHGGTPKWIVYFMENIIKMEDLGAVSGNFHISNI